MSLAFEQAFQRLEQILEQMNSGKTPLEQSIKLFEEAESLIHTCTTRLTDAEQKIEVLIKNRTGALAVGEDGKPRAEMFSRNV